MAATRSSLRSDLERLGLERGDLVMAHASIRSIGRIVGGVNVLIQSIEISVFDKRIAPAARDHGILHETLRNWPGAVRSDHPDAGVVAIGRLADWITSNHPLQYGYVDNSPRGKWPHVGGH